MNKRQTAVITEDMVRICSCQDVRLTEIIVQNIVCYIVYKLNVCSMYVAFNRCYNWPRVVG